MKNLIFFCFVFYFLAASMGQSNLSNNTDFDSSFTSYLMEREDKSITTTPIHHLLKWKLFTAIKAHLFRKLVEKLYPIFGRTTTTKLPSTEMVTGKPAGTTLPPTTPASNSTAVTCYKRNELMVLQDSSGSIEEDQFRTALNFTADLASAWRNFDDNRVGIGFFDSSTMPWISLPQSSHLNSVQIHDLILRAKQSGGGTAIHAAVEFATNEFEKYAREDVPHNLVVLTDGKSDLTLIKQATQRFYSNKNRRGFTVGIGASVSNDQLIAIAGEKPERVFRLTDFDQLLETLRALSLAICEG